MRRIVYAGTFDYEVEEIGFYIDTTFGATARRQFVAGLAQTCAIIVATPAIGTTQHDYDTQTLGFVFRQNWIFFEYDDEESASCILSTGDVISRRFDFDGIFTEIF